VDKLKDIEVASAGQKLWFGFPHYIVLGWALTLTVTLWMLRTDFYRSESEEQTYRVSQTRERDWAQNRTQESLTQLAEAMAELQRQTQELRTDAMRTRTIIELNFPKTARKVENALSGIEESTQ
jgi:hypothetical protein